MRLVAASFPSSNKNSRVAFSLVTRVFFVSS
nr:MAG TPA: hypothetical protein [Caudoviricetes sp.]